MHTYVYLFLFHSQYFRKVNTDVLLSCLPCMLGTGFPKKDAHFSKIKNIPDLFSYKEGKCELSTPNILAIGQVFLLIACESCKLIF